MTIATAKNKRKIRTRYRISLNNKLARPRLSVFRSNNHFYAQIIDDSKGETIVSASTNELEARKTLTKTNNVEAVKLVASLLSTRAQKAGVKEVVFDKGSYTYHGKVAVFADSCREAKILEF